MVRVLVPVLIIGVIMLGVFGVAVVLRPRREMSRSRQALLDEAARLFAELHVPRDLNDVVVIPDHLAACTRRWLDTYNKERR